jgi:hypothetical protein
MLLQKMFYDLHELFVMCYVTLTDFRNLHDFIFIVIIYPKFYILPYFLSVQNCNKRYNTKVNKYFLNLNLKVVLALALKETYEK